MTPSEAQQKQLHCTYTPLTCCSCFMDLNKGFTHSYHITHCLQFIMMSENIIILANEWRINWLITPTHPKKEYFFANGGTSKAFFFSLSFDFDVYVSTRYKNGHSGFYVVWSNEEATQDHEISSEDTLTQDNSYMIALARTSQYPYF